MKLTLGLILALVALLAAACGADPPGMPQTVAGGDPQRGVDAIQAYGCGACHTIDGVPGANGKVGPNLESVREQALIAGRLGNKPENLMAWIQHPQEIDPGVAMPDLGVTPQDARDIAAYLYSSH